MSQGLSRRAANQAPHDATFITQTPNANLANEQAMSALATGYVKNTTTTGVQSIQAIPIPIADGGTNNTSFTTNGVNFFDGTKIATTAVGATNTVLHGNTGAAPTYSAVSLTADVGTSVLPIANGGTNNSAALTAGSVIFSNGTSLTQDNTNLFWEDTAKQLLLGGATAASASIIIGANGSAIFNEQGSAVDFRVESDTSPNMFVVDGTNNRVDIGTGTQGAIAKFGSTEITFNENAAAQDFRVESQTNSNMLLVKANTSMVGIATSVPTATLTVNGGLAGRSVEKVANYTLTGSDFAIAANPTVATSITLTLPAAAGCTGRIYIIKKMNASATDTVTIDGNGTETIDGALTIVMTLQFSGRTIISDGANWFVIGST